MLSVYLNLPINIINYQIYLITLCINLLIISVASTAKFIRKLFLNNIYTKKLIFKFRKILKWKKKNFDRLWKFVLNGLLKDDLGLKLIDDHYRDRKNSVFFSNKHYDHQTRQVIEKVDMCMKWVSFWPKSVKLAIKHVETRLYIEAEYCSKVLNHCQQTRAQLNDDNANETFFNFIPIFMSTINREFELTNEIIQNCESLLTSEFIEPLENKIQDFNNSLLIIKNIWNERVNQMQDSTIDLRKCQKIYLRCALHYVKLTHTEIQNKDLIKDDIYLKREAVYKDLLLKAESEYKSKIAEVNRCMMKLERFKHHCLNEVQSLIDDASSEVRRLTLNYIVKLYPNQKNQLLNKLISIVPEVDFRTFVNNLRIPSLPIHSFTRYDKITC